MYASLELANLKTLNNSTKPQIDNKAQKEKSKASPLYNTKNNATRRITPLKSLVINDLNLLFFFSLLSSAKSSLSIIIINYCFIKLIFIKFRPQNICKI